MVYDLGFWNLQTGKHTFNVPYMLKGIGGGNNLKCTLLIV